MRAFVSWSGGKETSLSCYKVMQAQDVKITYLLNMISEDGRYSRTHGISSRLLKIQAAAIGIPIVQKPAAWKTYEEEFKRAISDFKKENVQVGVFGDIDIQEHRDWAERVCAESGIRPIFPLWKREREDILGEFIDSGFEAIVVAINEEALSFEWLGRKIDEEFIKNLRDLDKVDLCGEAGEYHTFVTSGPIFKKKIKLLNTKKTNRDKYWFLDILDYEIT